MGDGECKTNFRLNLSKHSMNCMYFQLRQKYVVAKNSRPSVTSNNHLLHSFLLGCTTYTQAFCAFLIVFAIFETLHS
jgi:hypothetical protein